MSNECKNFASDACRILNLLLAEVPLLGPAATAVKAEPKSIWLGRIVSRSEVIAIARFTDRTLADLELSDDVTYGESCQRKLMLLGAAGARSGPPTSSSLWENSDEKPERTIGSS